MSEQVGLIKLKGKIDGVSFFQADGKHLARMANGPSKERIKKDERFARTRENNNEFGGCALVAKIFRLTFIQQLKMTESRFSARLTGIFKEINRKGKGVRGQRSISLSKNTEQIINLEFNLNHPVTGLYTGLFNPENTDDRRGAIITLKKTLINKAIKSPLAATHIVFTQVLGVMSDFTYDTRIEKYWPMVSALENETVLTESDYISLDNKDPISLILESRLVEGVVLNENVSVIQCFGVAFYQLVGTEYRLLKDAQAMKVVNVF